MYFVGLLGTTWEIAEMASWFRAKPGLETCIDLLATTENCSCRKDGRSQRVDATLSDLEVVLMRQGRRYGLSAEQKADIWQRWKAGESLHEIGRDFQRCHMSAFCSAERPY